MTEQLFPRSLLYNIEPIGIETGLVESYSSYLIRVAYEHNITVGHLINKIVIPKMNKDYLERSTIYGGNSFYEGAKTINGFTDNTKNLIKVMELLTSREDLAYLTLYKLKGIIPLRNLLKNSLSWCPDCLKNWMDDEKIIYYPLIWYLKSVKVCFAHKRYLLEICSSCNKKIDILRRNMVPGHCPNCLELLIKDIFREEPGVQEMRWHTFVYQNTETLLGMSNSQLDFIGSQERVFKQLNLINEDLFSGDIANFAKFTSIPKTTLRDWLKRKSSPTFNSLLLVCYKLNIKLSDFLLQNNTKNVKITYGVKKEYVNKEKNYRKPLDVVAIENSLKELLVCDTPISMTAAAKIIGRDKRVLYSNFPDYCKGISKRYSEYIEEKSSHRIQLLKEEINSAFYSLINKGINPSSGKIEKYLNKNGLLREKILQDHWRGLLTQSNFSSGEGEVLFNDEFK
ncbi:TniQ family protein [Lysinibacillus agricola]|uniref:TniQ family protein n=1 Tax=Lysinibacillus agricola TaxID=2590012 RepID=UPI003C1702F6